MRLHLQLAAALLLLAAPMTALACSCVVPDGSRSDHVRRAFDRSTHVFSAYVESEHRAEGADSPRMVRLRVLQVWKGELTPDARLDVESDESAGLVGCGLEVQPETAILAYTTGDALVSCSMTGPLDDATPDIPLLDRLARRRR